MGTQYGAGVLRKYSMVSAVALVAALGMVDQSAAASMDTYHEALAGGNAKASAFEAMHMLEDQVLNGGASAEQVMKMSEQLMTGAVATGDERTIKWVSAAILKGAGEENFNAAELGIRVVVQGSRYQAQVSQISTEARSAMGVPVPKAPVVTKDVRGTVVSSEDRSFLGDLFSINRSSWSFSNRLSVGYDSNIYSDTREESGPVFKDSLNMGLSASSPRTAAQIFYKPTLTLSPSRDAGDKRIYQDFVGLLSHELSERNTLRLKDTFTYQEDERLTAAGVVNDNSYWKNNTALSLDRVMRANSRLSLTATGELKRYTDATQGLYRDYKLYSLGSSYSKTLNERTFSSVELAYTQQDFDSSPVEKSSATIFVNGGVNHQLNPDLVLAGYAGAQFVQPSAPAAAKASDTVVPYFNGQATYYFSPRTTLTGLVKYFYSPDSSRETAIGSESLRFELAGRHDFTEKISLTAKISRSTDTYPVSLSTATVEEKTTYDGFSTHLAYKISRIHTVDASYSFRATDSDVSGNYNRQQFELGWLVKF